MFSSGKICVILLLGLTSTRASHLLHHPLSFAPQSIHAVAAPAPILSPYSPHIAGLHSFTPGFKLPLVAAALPAIAPAVPAPLPIAYKHYIPYNVPPHASQINIFKKLIVPVAPAFVAAPPVIAHAPAVFAHTPAAFASPAFLPAPSAVLPAPILGAAAPLHFGAAAPLHFGAAAALPFGAPLRGFPGAWR